MEVETSPRHCFRNTDYKREDWGLKVTRGASKIDRGSFCIGEAWSHI